MKSSSCAPTRRFARARCLTLGLVVGLLISSCGDSNTDEATGQPEADRLASSDRSSSSEPLPDQVVPGVGGLDGVPESLFDGSVTVVVPNSAGTISTEGRQRVMAALVGAGPNAYLGGPDLPVTVRYASLDDEGLTAEIDGQWLTTNASALGLYVAPHTFEQVGLWQLTVLVGDREIGGALIEVVDDPIVPSIGEPAPIALTPTASTAEEIARISTDPTPDPGFYDLSLDEAVANGRPTVIAFATPAFCRTALCGPTLESVKLATADHDDIDVVHIEPFDIEQAMGGLLDPVPAMVAWGVPTEPWVFVVDADGNVAASFEGIMGAGELEAALAQL